MTLVDTNVLLDIATNDSEPGGLVVCFSAIRLLAPDEGEPA